MSSLPNPLGQPWESLMIMHLMTIYLLETDLPMTYGKLAANIYVSLALGTLF